MFKRKNKYKPIVVSYEIIQLEKHYIVKDLRKNKSYVKGVKIMDLDNEELKATKERTKENSGSDV